MMRGYPVLVNPRPHGPENEDDDKRSRREPGWFLRDRERKKRGKRKRGQDDKNDDSSESTG